MKQFEWMDESGYIAGPYDEDKALRFLGYGGGMSELDELAVSEHYTDDYGNVWTRLPDASAPDSTEPTRDERLERIAAAALQGLCANRPQLPPEVGPTTAARMAAAAAAARALIAELDKPE